MNLGDPELEVIDPTPNVHSLFLHFDKMFFCAKLASRAVVRWSKRMYSCAGVCTYEGRGGLCDIALSEPLLKLRSRKNLVETLIHEMIHAFLFITGNDRDRDGHGPNFQSHMYRINKAAGLNISIYHDFHDEVRLYQTHWWRCDGPCQYRKPYFGIVRRSANRAPGPNDFWWEDHKKQCGGTFIKTKEPDKKGKKATPKEVIIKPMGDITKYVTNGNKNITGKVSTKSNSTGTVIKKPGIVFNPKPVQRTIMDTKGFVLNENAVKSSDNVAETVRNKWLQKVPDLTGNSISEITEKVREVWANKVLESKPPQTSKKPIKMGISTVDSPPAKITKIDSYFKKATDLLKDIYGNNYTIQQKDKTSQLVAVKDPEVQIVEKSSSVQDKLECPICKCMVKSGKINSHIDECLNKEEIEKVFNEQPSCSQNSINITVIKKETDMQSPTVKTPNNLIELESKATKGNGTDQALKSIVKVEPGTSQEKVFKAQYEQICPCCGKVTKKSIDDHLDECLAFFSNTSTEPEEGNSFNEIPTIVIDDEDDVMDESETFNATGTKTPCPVCLVMVEAVEMNEHLDQCLM